MEQDTFDELGKMVFTEERFFAAVEVQPEQREDESRPEEMAQRGSVPPSNDLPAMAPPEIFHPAVEEQELQSLLFGENQSKPPEEPLHKGGEGEVMDGQAEEAPGIVGKGVPRGSKGVGAPYAPEGWQWIVRATARINAGGYYSDISRIPSGGPPLSSVKMCVQYLEETLGLSAEQRDEVMNSFETRIPASKGEVAGDVASSVGKRKRSLSELNDRPSKEVNGQFSDEGQPAEGTIIRPQNLVFEEEEEEEEEEEDANKVTLDEFLKSPEFWPSIGWRLRGPEGRAQLKELTAEARSRGPTAEASLKRLKLRLLKFPAFMRSEELEALPHILLTLVVLIMTEGAIYEAKSRKMLNGEVVLVIRNELTKHQKAAGLDKYGLPLKSREKRARKVSLNEAGPSKRRKSAPTATKEEEEPSAGKHRSLSDLPDKKSPMFVNRVVQLKPSLSGLSLEVDENDPEEETLRGIEAPEATTDALNAALEAAANTPRGENPSSSQADPGPAFGSPSFFADQNLGEEASHAEMQERETQTAGPMESSPPSQAAPVVQPPPPPAKPSSPASVEELEISMYRKKLVKLERKRKQWAQAFEQKLAAYRKTREELETKLEQRRAEQEAQKIKVVEETERLREMHSTALQDMTTLQAAAGVPDIAAQELEKRGSWEAIYTPAIDETRKTRKKSYEDMRKGVNEVKKSKQEMIRKRHEAYRQLGMALPQAEIDQERAQYSAEITEMQAKLEAQKVQLDADSADLEQKATTGKNAFNEYKNQHKKLVKEEARLQQLLQEPIV